MSKYDSESSLEMFCRKNHFVIIFLGGVCYILSIAVDNILLLSYDKYPIKNIHFNYSASTSAPDLSMNGLHTKRKLKIEKCFNLLLYMHLVQF